MSYAVDMKQKPFDKRNLRCTAFTITVQNINQGKTQKKVMKDHEPDI